MTQTSKTVQVTSWMGTPITELSKEELIEVINYCQAQIKNLTEDRSRWMRAASPMKYIMDETNVSKH